jgi:hypothetical protein
VDITRLSAQLKLVRGNGLSLGILLICIPLAAWWAITLAQPGWDMWMRLPGEIVLPLLVACLVHFAFFLAREEI